MTIVITHTLLSFHKRAQELKKQLRSSRLAWQQTEKEYYEKYSKNRYSNFESFKVSHCQVVKFWELV
jgi:hypothetical protein